jgi:Protein of unknown function (DUF1565)
MKVVLLSVSLLSLLAPAALAGEFFVNVATGSDANPGTSPGAPWKTLTHALSLAADFDDFIHVAPGDYSPATGEVFPLELGSSVLLGDQGSAVTRIIGTGSEVLLRADDGNHQSVQLEGLSLFNAVTALQVVSTNDFSQVRTADVVIVSTSGFAVDLDAHAEAGTSTEPSIITCLDGLSIGDCGGGIRLTTTSAAHTSLLTLSRSSISDSSGDGIRLESVAGGKILLSFTQVRVLRNVQAGVRAVASGSVEMGFGSCLIADNGTGIDVANDGGALLLGLSFSTVAGNAGSGLHVEDGLPATSIISGSLFWGNGADITGGSVVSATNSDSEQGVFGTAEGNFSADPQFRNAAQGDYHLSFGSPCIEAGNSAFAVADLDGAQRPADGDLDTLERVDVGCFELNPLVVETTGELGTEVIFQSFGSPCMQTTLFVAPGVPAIAHKTAFGQLRIGPSGILPLLVTIALSPDPALVVATIPNIPVLVGSTYSFQSLTQSVVAPKGAALTNVESFTVIE